MQQADIILCECELPPLEAFVSELEKQCTVQIVRHPAIASLMIRAEDSVEGQPFYLGEALITECELTVDGQAGLGLCLGDEPVRSYCIAVIDALLQLADGRLPLVRGFLAAQATLIDARLQAEQALIQRTKVDFKLMEEE
ncbi:MAG TPA: phosphonate C-P lyase system protein PhnG [Puia sp.]|jgi:alpha-D-ribose 1-methylphosphonate 5-triphosphate synthase subunit PhnG|nr:phosphonate C-P lyase system protein PhnG [Puia sp.]